MHVNGRQLIFKINRFKVVANLIHGFKPGRLPNKGISSYWRFKPFYFSWGKRMLSGSLLRNFHVRFYQLEIVPFRVQVFATPKDVWEHWAELRKNAKART